MTAGKILHQDDGGNVSLFGRDKQMLFACDKGHWWIVEAASAGTNEESELEADDGALADLRKSFGDAPLRAMRLDR